MKQDVHAHLSRVLQAHKSNAGYVLITCDQLSEEGPLEVEMTYGGDVVLAAYLVESAQTLLEEDIHEQV